MLDVDPEFQARSCPKTDFCGKASILAETCSTSTGVKTISMEDFGKSTLGRDGNSGLASLTELSAFQQSNGFVLQVKSATTLSKEPANSSNLFITVFQLAEEQSYSFTQTANISLK